MLPPGNVYSSRYDCESTSTMCVDTLIYNYRRSYDPQTGRFLQSDPLGLYDGPNTYAYAYQSPLTNADPTGEFVPAACIAAPWICGAVVSIATSVISDIATQIGMNLLEGDELLCLDRTSIYVSAAASLVPGAIFARHVQKIKRAQGAAKKLDDALAGYSKNDIHHLFGRGGEGPSRLLEKYGSPESALRELQRASQGIANRNYQTGSWVTVKVNGSPVTIKGVVIDGVFKVSSIAKRPFQ